MLVNITRNIVCSVVFGSYLGFSGTQKPVIEKHIVTSQLLVAPITAPLNYAKLD